MAFENDFLHDKEYGKTIIQRGVVLHGDITSSDDIDLWGNLVGNIKSEGDARIGGKVQGDVAADRIGVYAGAVQGNVTGRREITVDEDSVVIGNLACSEDVNVYGKIKGDISSSGRATLQSAAQMIGDVTAKLISLNEGARVRGKITMASTSPDIDFDTEIKF